MDGTAWTGKTPSSVFSWLNSPSTPHLQNQQHLFESNCASRRSFAAGWEGTVGVAAGWEGTVGVAAGWEDTVGVAAGWEGTVGMAADCGMIGEDD